MPKRLGLAYEGEFEAWEPDAKLAQTEAMGFQSWTGGELPFITAKEHIPVTPLEPSLEKLLKSVWESSKAPNPMTKKQYEFSDKGAKFIKDTGEVRQRQQLMGHQRQAGWNPLLKNWGPPASPSSAPRPALVNPSKNPMPTPASGPNPAPHLAGIARDWALMKDSATIQINRVVAYAFRGDGRDPMQIKQAGGFKPPSTRNDEQYLFGAVFEQFQDYVKRRFGKDITLHQYKAALTAAMDAETKKLFMEYSTWRAIMKAEEMHLGRMLANEALKGYTSTTRAVTVAKGFAKTGGWVYCLLVRGGYLVPAKDAIEWTKLFGEQEVAFPGSIAWENVIACRKVGAGVKFEGPILLRTKFSKIDVGAAKQIYELLSGKVQ